MKSIFILHSIQRFSTAPPDPSCLPPSTPPPTPLIRFSICETLLQITKCAFSAFVDHLFGSSAYFTCLHNKFYNSWQSKTQLKDFWLCAISQLKKIFYSWTSLSFSKCIFLNASSHYMILHKLVGRDRIMNLINSYELELV